VQASGFSISGSTCSASLGQRVVYSPNTAFQNPSWNSTGDYMVLAGTTNSQDTTMNGVAITNVCHTPGCPGGATDSVSWGCSVAPTNTTNKAYIYNLTLTYGYAAEAYLLQYFRNVAHRPGAIDVINWEEWINDSNNAQGFPLCFGFGGGYTSTGCTNLTLNGQALGEALKWMRLGGGVKPTSAFQCQFLSLGTAPSTKCPFQGIMFATGVEANGTQVEVVFYSDPVNHSTSANPFTAPSWAQHYLAVDGTCTSVTGGTTQVTLTHAKPIMFTSD
jgi:hypothetical protein